MVHELLLKSYISIKRLVHISYSLKLSRNLLFYIFMFGLSHTLVYDSLHFRIIMVLIISSSFWYLLFKILLPGMLLRNVSLLISILWWLHLLLPIPSILLFILFFCPRNLAFFMKIIFSILCLIDSFVINLLRSINRLWLSNFYIWNIISRNWLLSSNISIYFIFISFYFSYLPLIVIVISSD